MSKRLLSCCFLSLLVLAASTATAQITLEAPASSEASAAKAEEAREELEKKALSLLEETIADTRGLKLAENRVRAQVIAAGLLWSHDEDAARALFKEATGSVVQLVAGNEATDPQFYNTMQVISQLRNEMLQTLAQRDPQLALDFLRATRQPPPYSEPGAPYKQVDQELALEMSLAAQITARDPKMAIRMAEESLNKGVTSNLVNVVRQIAMKDPEAAAKLATQIIKKIRPEDFTRDYEMGSVALQLLSLTRIKEPTPPPAPPAPSNGPVPVVSVDNDGPQSPMMRSVYVEIGITIDESVRRELIETIVAAALDNSPTRSSNSFNLFVALRAAMPEVEKYAPTRVAALRRRMAETERTLDPRSRVWAQYQEVMQQGTVDTLLEVAPKAPAQVREQLYVQAAWKAVGENNLDRARQIIEKLSNPQQRAQMLKDIERQLPWRAAEQGNFEEARQMLARLSTIEERVPALIQIAVAARAKGDTQAARVMLDEARDLVTGHAQNVQQFYAQLEVASAYAGLDRGAAFEVVEAAIAQLNELIAAAAVVNGFGQDSFREGELKPQGGYIWNDLITRCAATLATLAPSDFERARAAARKFQRPDARTMAQLMLAQNILTSITPQDQQLGFNKQSNRRVRSR